MLEASFSGKPILAPVSIATDFLDKNYVVELPHEMTKVSQNAFPKGYVMPESSWSTVNYNVAARLMLDVYEKYDKYKVKGKKLGIVNRNTFNHEEMKKKLLNIVDKLVDDIKVQDKLFHKNMPKKVELKLPTLKKEPKKLNLPKLKKG